MARKNATQRTRSKVRVEVFDGDKRNVGRPRTSLKDLPSNWKKLMLDVGESGGSVYAMMKKLGVGSTAFETLLTDHAEFRDIYADSLLAARVWWETCGQKMADGKKRYGSAPVWALNMTNRFGWKSSRSEVVGDPSAPLGVANVKPLSQFTEDEITEELKKRGLPADILAD